ncbi:MAG: tetratricopeptide repeat protein [Candidatus Cloacimonetes bacterium]|nr:tetratricopeptide repeat protein [Candidatus Cloacimonadota bacterium]
MNRHIITLLLLICCICLEAQNTISIRDSYNAETTGDYSRALDVMIKLATADANDEFYQLRLGWLYYMMQDYASAFNHYQKSNTLVANLDAQLGMLNCHLALGKWNDALALAHNILKQYPQHTTVMSKAAYASYMKQDYKDAADYYQRVLKINQWDMDTLGYLVANLYLSNQLTEAKQHFQKLKKYYPASAIITDYGKYLN